MDDLNTDGTKNSVNNDGTNYIDTSTNEKRGKLI